MASPHGRGSRSGPHRPLESLPRPARPLRRARAAGRRVGRDGGDPLRRARSQCRRPSRRRPRPRLCARPARRRDLLRHRGCVTGAPWPSARARRQALPPLRGAVRVRAGLRGPPGPLLVPELRCGQAGSRHRRDQDRARRHARLPSRGRDPQRAARAPSAPPRPLQRLQRPGGPLCRPAPGRGARGGRDRPRAHRGGLRARRDGGSGREAGLHPADQESRRSERGPSHPAPRERAVRGRKRACTSGSR